MLHQDQDIILQVNLSVDFNNTRYALVIDHGLFDIDLSLLLFIIIIVITTAFIFEYEV